MSDAPPAPPQDLTGRTLGEFQVLRKLGQGGMGQVYLARQLSLKREVALKILRDDHAANPTAQKRFQAEAEAVARISHPNIVQVYAVGEHDGLKYMALEYVEGRNLREYLDRKGPPDLPVAVAILKQVAAALQKAAELGLVHRDIKPENILLNRKVEVKVTDFGLSRYFGGDGQPLSLTQSGMTLGTPLYMSPEQVQGKAVDHRSDLYSFGVTAYHLLAGFPPFKGANAFEVAVKHVQDAPEPLHALRPDLPPELCGLVHKLMAKNPDDRYAAAKDVSRDLSRIQKGVSVGELAASGSRPAQFPLTLNVTLSGTSVAGVTVPGSQTASPPAGDHRWAWRGLGGVAVLASVGLGWWLFGRTHAAVEAVTQPTIPGLPDIRPAVPLASARETALREQLRTTPPADRKHLEAGMELGLLCVAERRLDDADKVFKDLDGPAPRPAKPSEPAFPVPATMLSRFGQAIVLAHQDKPAESNKMFDSAVTMTSRPAMRNGVERLCFEYPYFGRAIADAVGRNADHLPKDAKLPSNIEWLRNPSSVLRGPK